MLFCHTVYLHQIITASCGLDIAPHCHFDYFATNYTALTNCCVKRLESIIMSQQCVKLRSENNARIKNCTDYQLESAALQL